MGFIGSTCTALPRHADAPRDVGAADGHVAEALPAVGSDRCCSPRHRVSYTSRDEGLKCVG